MTDHALTPLQRLLERRLALQQLDRDLFVGDPGPGERRLFGGMVAAQSLVAGYRTLEREQGEVHSLHAYFLRPGQHGVPITHVVHRIRDGRSFSTRRIVAHQAGEAIFSLEASFAKPEEGPDHQEPMPHAPPPLGLPEWDSVRNDRERDPGRWEGDNPIEMLACDPAFEARMGPPARRQVWIRARGTIPVDDYVMHAAVITFASDRGMLSTIARVLGLPRTGRGQSASLDHNIWFHRPPRFDGWLLYTTDGAAAHSARALIQGTLYREDGTLQATVVQEGLVRPPRAAPK